MNQKDELLPVNITYNSRGAGMAVLLLLVCCGLEAYAQETRIEVQVTYIAGQDIYLDAGQDQGIQTGDTLAVYRDEVFRGQFVVQRSTATRSVVGFAAAPFPVTLGTH